jgi:isocitrate/isopropylmalate dehydrogenase
MSKKIVVIPGDGIGQEITDSAVAVLKKVSDKYNLKIQRFLSFYHHFYYANFNFIYA